jgi:hypothetical protein
LSSLLTNCISLVETFGEIAAGDVMVTGPAPEKLGIGLARGTATRLVSEGMVLDYTGRCLNLAARLMDKARPSGVVFHDDHAAELMDETIAARFSRDNVCIRGISEQNPLPIYITEPVLIRPADREPSLDSDYQYGEPAYLTVAQVRSQASFGFRERARPRRPTLSPRCSPRRTLDVVVAGDKFEGSGWRQLRGRCSLDNKAKTISQANMVK